MQAIISAVSRELLKSELTASRMVRPTNKLNNEIYIINGNECPHTMQEIGRLREVSFREAGGGSGKDCDIDNYDIGRYAYQQLVVWNPQDEQIVGGYRYIVCSKNIDEDGNYQLSTSEIVQYTEKLKTDFFPYTIELGRSFVQPNYQPSKENRSGIYSLDNLWDGLGTLTVLHPEVRYFFGKITMYTHFNSEARDHILAFMHHYFPDKDKMVIIPNALVPKHDCSEFIERLSTMTYKEGHAHLNQLVRGLGESIPPLFNAYMNLSPTMRTFGTAVNDHFGYVEETGIMVTIADIFDEKKERYINSFIEYLQEQ